MKLKKIPTTLFFLFFTFLFVDGAIACECGASETTASVAEAMERSESVITATIIEIIDHESGDLYDQVVKVRVEKVYKGSLKTEDILPFGQAGGKDCLWYFSKDKIGKTFLFYLNKPTKARPYKMTDEIEKSDAEPRYYVSTCGRSALIEKAEGDISFLKKKESIRPSI